VQGSESLQFSGGLQPSVGSQILFVQGLETVGHTVAVLTHLPFWQVSFVHKLLSLQLRGGLEQPITGLQVSRVQKSPSLQVRGVF